MTLLLCLFNVVILLHLKCLTGQDVRCPKGQWQCDDGNCIPYAWRCDKDGDCLDGSDELDCSGTGEPCGRGQLACVDSPGCVDRSELCDGRHHCFSGSDEANCTVTVGCLDSDWTCLNGLCVSKEFRCDGKNDCLDKGASDEKDCGRCEEDGLRCPEGTCVSAQERCDGKAHCSDASDEPNTCGGQCSVNNGGCSHVCVDELWGTECACPPGYTLAANGVDCTDVDECAQTFPVCSHYCSNTIGSFFCDCKPGFKLNGTACLATGNPVMLLTQRKGSIVLLDSKSHQLVPRPVTAGSDPVCLTYDLARGWFYWADRKGAILKSDGRGTATVYTGEPGIKSLACDWLNGHLYWTNERTRTIYMGSPDGRDFTTVLSKDISPRDLVLLPVESSMFWINAGPGEAVTLETSWMDGSEATTLAVLTAQAPQSLTIDVAARRLYWLSILKMSVETVKVDGTGRHSFTGKLGSKHPYALAVFGDWFYWADPMGVWAAPQNQLDHRIFLQNVVSPMLTVYHELQQPKGPSACEKSPCQLCLLTKENPAGFICACPNDQVLMPDMPCDYPRFLYGTLRAIHQLEFRGSQVVQTLVFSPNDVIVSYDVDFYRDWIYWVNETGEIKRTPFTQDKVERIPTITPVCRLRVDQRSGALYWMSCDQTAIGVTAPRQGRPKVLYRTASGGEVRDLYVDWLRARLLWLEADRVLGMSLSGGPTTELLKLGGDVHVSMAFDLRANNLLWHTGSVGLSSMSILNGRTHLAGEGWNISGSVVAAFEPFLLSVSDDITLWDRRDRRRIRDVKAVDDVLEVMVALKDIKAGKNTVIPKVPVQDVRPPQPPAGPACFSPSVLCPRSAVPLCLSSAQLCDGHKDCPDGFDEANCVKRCPSKNDFRCKDRRSCVSRRLVCDGRSHCQDGSDELDCPSISAAPSPSDVLKCRKGSRPCGDGRKCVPYSHECDGEADCQDGSDEHGCDPPVTATKSSPALNLRPSSQSQPPDEVTTTTAKPSCIYPSFLCPGSSVCISSSRLCDKKKDCPDEADEKNCVSKCPDRSDFRCKDRRSCVSRRLVCDGRSHCQDGSDELDCPSTRIPAAPSPSDVLKCRRGTRPCSNGRECVLLSHVCDGDADCQDGSDEEDCPDSCKKGEFQCVHGKRCIPSSQVCDGAAQCRDNSDELDCWRPSSGCQLRCDNKTRCLPASHLCDGERDCRDGTDEEGCVSEPIKSRDRENQSEGAGPPKQPQEAGAPSIQVSTTPSIQPVSPSMPPCVAPSVRCPDSPVCISQSQLCDGRRDCPKGTDERGCLKRCRNANEFLCKDKRKCVPQSQRCDGRSHCPDGSDEKDCITRGAASYYSAPSASEVLGPLKCRLGSRPCKDGTECVLYSHVCDGEPDCKDGSDEEGCAIQCQTAEFQCAHGRKCIPKTQVCDGRPQCQDRSDESGCRARAEACHHQCDNATRCVPENFLCDGEKDCADGSDEDKCGLHPCGISQFRCASGQCISEALRCDGYADCRDRSDEAGCSRPPRCPPELRCPHSHQCIMREWFCDGENDCQDGADEKDCASVPVTCKEFQWKCGDSNQCIPLSWRCDGQMDCHNGIDENKCRRPSCPPQHFQCSSGECLKPSLVCNGITNCPDSSDEGVGCAQSNCSSTTAPPCGHQCISTPQGPRCSCAAGFKLKSNGIACVDIDECNEVKPAVCQHLCSNTRGSYVCHCYTGFLLEPDSRSCKSQDEPLLLASVQSQLLLLGVHSSTVALLSLANRPVFSLDLDWWEQRVYWVSSYESIRWANLNDTSRIGTLFKGVKPDVIALDWVGRNLYWIDGLVAQILAVSLSDSLAKPQNYTVILDEELEQPSSLVLIPNKGLMLWSEIGSAPQIGRAGMDGTRRQVIVNKGLSWPVSLTFDFLDNRVYWADEKLRCIGSTSLDGQGVKILQLAEMASPFAVEVFNNRVFWSDTKRRTIRSADKNTGKNQKVLLKRPGQPFALRLIHPLSQPHVSNPCRRVRCSHLCVLSPANKALPGPGAAHLASQGPTAVCRCPPGLSLNKDKVTCALSLDATFLLLLSPDTVTQVYLRSLHEGSNLKSLPSSRVLGLPGMSVSTGLDAVVSHMSLYVASSGLVTQLRLGNTRSRQGLTPVGRILRLRDDVITAMAVDWVTSNLYWSSSKLPLLHVTSSHFGYTIPLLQGSLQGTTSIALLPPAGRLCYSVIRKVEGSSHSQIECAFMDGRSWQLLWGKCNMPTSVVFSSGGNEVFWADIGDGSINSIGLDGSGYRQYKTGPNLVTFTQTDNLLLWITREKGTSRLWYSNNTQHRELWFQVETSFVTMKSYSRTTQSGSNSCSEHNGGCQHLCLAHPGGRTCRCDRDFRPVGDTTCVPLPPCTSVSRSCWDGSKCLLSSKFCDGHVDCADMSDEVDCPNKISMASDKPSAPGPDLKKKKTSSPSSPADVRTDSEPLLVRDSSSCGLQICSGHGSCVPEGKETLCHCDDGYEGANCDRLTSTSHAPVVLGMMVLVAGLAAIVVLYKKRRSLNRSTSSEKETLMTDMGPALPGNLYDHEMEDLDSPVDAFNVRAAEFREPPLFDSAHSA